MAAYRRVNDLQSPAGWLPVHRDQLRTQRLMSSMGSFTFLLTTDHLVVQEEQLMQCVFMLAQLPLT